VHASAAFAQANRKLQIHYIDVGQGDGAVGVYQFDSTTMSNGLQIISWAVRDNAGVVQGVGSRFFRVQNP
jgi:hypothetical protein